MAAATSVVMQPLPTPIPAVAAMDVSDVDMVAFLTRCLLDPSMPIALRWRAILSLRNRKGRGSRQALVAALSDESALLAHEAAFSLGQMQDPESIPGLRATLKGIQEFHPIVRHEVQWLLF
jgi:HEAT repeat protein